MVYEEGGELNICDLFLNTLKKEEEMRIYVSKSPKELNGYECNDRSVIRSIGCILYEMILKKLPFNEYDNMNKTMNNIVRCKYSLDIEYDEMMQEMLERMLRVKSEYRLSLIELNKEMMICKERKEMMYKNDYKIIKLPVIYPPKYNIESDKSEEIRDLLIESYNNKRNERIL